MRSILFFYLFFIGTIATGQVTISIDALKARKNISPDIYGRNNSLPKESYAATLTPAEILRLKDSGVNFLREGGGNNATKYNWRKGISSHPDWYNNVYGESWDNPVKYLRDQLPGNITGMWSFQLIGKAAANTNNNFNDWGYNSSQWWTGAAQNLAGGGVPNTAGGSVAKVNGNPNLYLQDWNADSTTGILDYWFNTLNIPKQRITYWNMDNEPEIWNGTHDDIVPTSLSAETFMQNYFAVAKKARAKFPDIKLVGPVTANEWQWFNWMNKITGTDGKTYPWLEFFIKRCAEEQKASGVRLLDIFDIHFYPNENTAEQIVQLHNVFFNRNYNYVGANGVKNVTGNWDNTQTKEYIFGRVNDWLDKYFGANHGIKLGVTEMDVNSNDATVNAVWYASMMGEFMKNDVAVFTPWSWKPGMWETLHLFARYNKIYAVQGASTDETNVSAYPSINNGNDSMTVVLVNRSTTATKNTTVNFSNFKITASAADILSLTNLPVAETFNSHTQNALQKSTVNFSNNSAMLNLPPMSITSFTVKGIGAVTATTQLNPDGENNISVVPNPVSNRFELKNADGFENLFIVDVAGRILRQFANTGSTTFDISDLPKGIYEVVVTLKDSKAVSKLVKL